MNRDFYIECRIQGDNLSILKAIFDEKKTRPIEIHPVLFGQIFNQFVNETKAMLSMRRQRPVEFDLHGILRHLDREFELQILEDKNGNIITAF